MIDGVTNITWKHHHTSRRTPRSPKKPDGWRIWRQSTDAETAPRGRFRVAKRSVVFFQPRSGDGIYSWDFDMGNL